VLSTLVDLQCMSDSPGYILGTEFVELYRSEVGAFEPQEDFWDRHRLYRMCVFPLVETKPLLGMRMCWCGCLMD